MLFSHIRNNHLDPKNTYNLRQYGYTHTSRHVNLNNEKVVLLKSLWSHRIQFIRFQLTFQTLIKHYSQNVSVKSLKDRFQLFLKTFTYCSFEISPKIQWT